MAKGGQQFKVSKEDFATKVRTNPKYKDWASNSAKEIGHNLMVYDIAINTRLKSANPFDLLKKEVSLISNSIEKLIYQ